MSFGDGKPDKDDAEGTKMPCAERVVEDHLSWVRAVASEMSRRLPRGVDVEDLVCEGVAGLLEAERRFDPGRGVKFETYAKRRVRGAMLDWLRSLDWAPRRVRRRIREAGEASGLAPGRRVALSGLDRGRVESLEELREAGVDVEDPGSDPLEFVLERDLAERAVQALMLLPERERLVVELVDRRGERVVDAAIRLGVTPARVSQIRSQALERLRVMLDGQPGGRYGP